MSSEKKSVAECSISASSEIEEAVGNLTTALKKIVLKTSDGEAFEIDESVAREFQIVAHMIEDNCAGEAIPLDNVNGEILALVIEYGKKHVEAGVIDEEDEEAKQKMKDWDTEFMKNLDLDTIFHMILAANYLNFERLLNLASQTVADYIKDKEPEEVRKIFNIENDFTPEEEEEIRKENAWTFDDPTL